MGKSHKKSAANASGKAVAKAQERKETATKHATEYLQRFTEDLRLESQGHLEEFLKKLKEVPPGDTGAGDYHSVIVQHTEQLLECLQMKETFAIETSKALSTAANEGNSVGHANYCKRVGLEELFRTCSRTVQDAVAMNMITDPQAFNDIMNLQIEVNVRSRLRHAYFIQKRLLKDIGQQLVIMGSESENAEGSNGEESAKQPPTGSTPEPPPAVSGGAPGLGLVTGSPESDALMHSTFSAMGGGYPSLPPTHSTPFDPQFWGSNPFGSSLTAAMVAQGLGIPPQDYGCPFPAVPPYLDPYASPLPPQLSSSSVGSNNKVGRRVSNNSSNKMMQSSPPTSALSTSDPDGPAYVDVKWDTSLGAPPNLTRMEDEKLPPARTDGSFLLDDAS